MFDEIPGHWTSGGTGITNFDISQKDIYSAAIKEYGDNDLFIGPAMSGESETMLALHSHNRNDLSEFWCIFRKIKKSFEDN